jgi:hypothetical protein
MAREGADISIVFLPAEQVDAETTKGLVEKEGVQCLLIQGDLRDLNFCREAVEKHVAKYEAMLFFISGNKPLTLMIV